MKISKQPTNFLLIKANTNSEWDSCDFAVISLSEEWKTEQLKRLEAVKPFAKDVNFQSLNYYDTAADFYQINKDEQPDIEQLLAGKEWAFAELNENEQNSFAVPKNRLDCYRLVMYKNGKAMYHAYGKHSGEEFWTDEFDIKTICSSMNEETETFQ